jgi:hypothetical protein
MEDKNRAEQSEHEIVRTKSGRFKKGHSGNPTGRAASPFRREIRDSIRERLPELVQKTIEQALEGCTKSMELLFNKVLPNARQGDMPLGLNITKNVGTDAKQLLELSDELITAVVQDKLEASVAEKVVMLLAEHRKIIETEEVQRELDKLKEVVNK